LDITVCLLILNENGNLKQNHYKFHANEAGRFFWIMYEWH